MKILNARTHGILDYVLVALFALGPTLFGFYDWAATASYALAVAYLVLTLATDFPLGAMKLVPFRTHGMIEMIVGLVLIIAPWFYGDPARGPAHIFAVAVGIIIVLAWFLTDYSYTRVVAATSAPPGAPPAA